MVIQSKKSLLIIEFACPVNFGLLIAVLDNSQTVVNPLSRTILTNQ